MDYQAPPPKKLGRSSSSSPDDIDASSPSSVCQLNRGTKHEEATGSEGHRNTAAKRKAVRHEQFERMARKFGYTSRYDFAVHVKEASKEERREMLDEFYEVWHQKERENTGDLKLVSQTSDSITRVHINPGETDSSPPTNIDRVALHHEHQSTATKFDCSSNEKRHQGMRQSCVAASLLDELFEATQPTVRSPTLNRTHDCAIKKQSTVAQKQTESGPSKLNLAPTSRTQKTVCTESSINIDELFG